MRKFLILPIILLTAWQVVAQTGGPKYEIDFNPATDRTLWTDDDGIHISVRFFIKLGDKRVEQLDGDYKVLIKENGKEVKRVVLPRLIASEELSVILALDTSGSMSEHGRMEQARGAADMFLNKLPKATDCGLLLFDHVIRDRLPLTFERPPLLKKINEIEPRGGTAYLDAAAEGVTMLRDVPRGRGRAVVLMTDGIDLNSKQTIEQVIAQANRERVKVYTIGIGEAGKFQPVNTVLVLDHSGSMKPPADDIDTTPKIEALHLAAERFVESMSRVGRASIIPFSTKVGRPQPFRDKTELDDLRASIRKLTPVGETALFDATYDGVCVLEADNAKGRRAVIAMTDGIDNSSRRRVEEVVARALEAKIPLYLLGFGRASELDEATMRLMAESTGGKFYHAKNKDSLIEIFENLSTQLHDVGIDEETLKRIARETGGLYYPAEKASELRMIFDKIAQDIKPRQREEIFKSLNQRADGTERKVTLVLVQSGSSGAPDQIVDEREGRVQVRGLVVAEMSPFVYLPLLILIGALIALPGLLKRASGG